MKFIFLFLINGNNNFHILKNNSMKNEGLLLFISLVRVISEMYFTNK